MLNALTAPMVKLTQNGVGGYDFNVNCVYFFAELLKLIVAVSWCASCLWLSADAAYDPRSFDRTDVLAYALPALCFFVQNNLSFVALQHMTASAFQLLLNLRIVVVGGLTVTVLHRPLNSVEWIAIGMLTIGAMQYQLASAVAAKPFSVDATGICMLAVIVTCAAASNIYTQKVMQQKMAQPLMVQNAVLYAWGLAFNAANWAWSARAQPAFGAMGGWQLASIAFYAVFGLTISAIIKHFGSLARTFINTAAICLTAVLDVTMFGETITVLQATAFAIIFIAVCLYSTVAPEVRRLQAALDR